MVILFISKTRRCKHYEALNTPMQWTIVKYIYIYIQIENNNPHSNAKRCIRILGARQAAWHTLFLACPVDPTRCGAAHSKYCGKREHQCGEDVYLKTETKPFTQNAYLFNFLEGNLSSLHSCLTQVNPKTCTIYVSSTIKKHVITRLRN